MKLIVEIPDEEYKSYTFLSNIGMGSTAIRRILDGKPYEECKLDIIGLDKQIDNCRTEESIMPNSCKCILNKMVFKGAMTEKERDKIVRNIKMEWIPVTERLPEENGRYLCTYQNEDGVCIDFGMYEDGEWYVSGAITWMPLPEPYKEGAE